MHPALRLVLCVAIGSILYAGQVVAQSVQPSSSVADTTQLKARLDALEATLKQAQDTIAQQQAILDALAARAIQADSTTVLTAPGAPTPPISGQSAAPQQASNLLNPNVSLIGDFRGQLGHDLLPKTRAFTLREAEIGLQAPVDPYARADAFISVSPDEGVDVEEVYLTLQTIPLGLQAKLGKFRSNFGKFNRTHPPETPFSDRPLATEAFFGPEGLSGIGGSLSWLIPNPWVYLNLDAELTNTWEGAPAFGELDVPSGEVIIGGRRRDLGYLTRLSTFFDLSESANLTAGTTYATGVHDLAGNLRTHLEGFDLTFRWKPPRRAIYYSLLWQTEVLLNQRAQATGGHAKSTGLFSYLDWQFQRRWHLGTRYDYTQFPETSARHEQGILGYLTFTPSEFSLITWQSRAVQRIDGTWHWVGLLKVTFNIGPHGAHPF